jgi:hypothetical protein
MSTFSLPPIKLQRVPCTDGSGEFIIRAEHLPAAIWDHLTEDQKKARYDAEKAAIHAEWDRIKKDGA